MPVTTSTETVTSSTGQCIPHRFLLRREIGSVSTHYTLATPEEGDVGQHGRLFFRGVIVSISIRILASSARKGHGTLISCYQTFSCSKNTKPKIKAIRGTGDDMDILLTVHCDKNGCRQCGRKRLGHAHHGEPGLRRLVVIP